jgi:hypothetical protein
MRRYRLAYAYHIPAIDHCQDLRAESPREEAGVLQQQGAGGEDGKGEDGERIRAGRFHHLTPWFASCDRVCCPGNIIAKYRRCNTKRPKPTVDKMNTLFGTEEL